MCKYLVTMKLADVTTTLGAQYALHQLEIQTLMIKTSVCTYLVVFFRFRPLCVVVSHFLGRDSFPMGAIVGRILLRRFRFYVHDF